MGARLSPVREAVPLLEGLTLLNRGKVRDTYDLSGDKLLIVTTDAISIFDFTLNALVPQKGLILNALTHFWLKLLHQYGIGTHLVAAGQEVDYCLPEGLRGNSDLLARSMVVQRITMQPVEFVARAYLTGSGLKSYRDSGTVCGHSLPKGLQDGDRLHYILDTPTTKAEVGHDEHLNAEEIRGGYPAATYLLIKAFQIASHHAEKSGIILADTKLEFGWGSHESVILGDEVFTPDSSRFWSYADWLDSRKKDPRKAPTSLDKQLVRIWGLTQKINELDPANPEHLAQVHRLTVPPELINATTQTYRYIFWRLTGQTLENYLKDCLGVCLDKPRKKVAIIFGSQTDLKDEITYIIRDARVRYVQSGELGDINVHVISCHRHPAELRRFIQEDKCRGADVIIAAGGKALALPGIIKASLNEAKLNIPVVGVALGELNTKALTAAQLSIDELPGQPVVTDEINQRVYTSPEGLRSAIARTVYGEFPPPKPPVDKPAEFDVNIDKL